VIWDSNPKKSSNIHLLELKMGKPSDRDRKYMRDMWGTEALVTDYGSFYDKNQKKMLREVENDEIDQKSKNIDNVINADTSGDFIID
jgi:hypothetical protein